MAPALVEATTGAARIDTRSWSPTRLLTRAEYASRIAGDRYGVPADKDPWSGDAGARYGFLGYDAESRVAFAARLSAKGTPQVLADENVNGDLRDDAARTATATENPPGFRVEIELREPATRLAVGFQGQGDEVLAQALMMTGTLRDGRLLVGHDEIRFTVEGDLGRYGEPWQSVYFDTDADGHVDLRPRSDDRYVFGSDEYVSLGGRSWRFAAAADGTRLTLTALDEPRPARPRLGPGNPAPDFAFTDIDGVGGRLADYAGRVTLLYFWGTWCGPCRGETPYLTEAYERFHERGFEVLAVATEDQPDDVRGFAAEHGIAWRQVVEGRGGPIVALYRAHAVPTEVLIDRAGTIISNDLRGPTIGEEVAALIDDGGSAADDESRRPGSHAPN